MIDNWNPELSGGNYNEIGWRETFSWFERSHNSWEYVVSEPNMIDELDCGMINRNISTVHWRQQARDVEIDANIRLI